MENAPANTAAPTIPVPTTPLGAMQTNVSRQSIMKQMAFLFAIAASIAVGGYVLMWAQTANSTCRAFSAAPSTTNGRRVHCTGMYIYILNTRRFTKGR